MCIHIFFYYQFKLNRDKLYLGEDERRQTEHGLRGRSLQELRKK